MVSGIGRMQKQLLIERAAVERDKSWRKILTRAEKELAAETGISGIEGQGKQAGDATFLLKSKKE